MKILPGIFAILLLLCISGCKMGGGGGSGSSGVPASFAIEDSSSYDTTSFVMLSAENEPTSYEKNVSSAPVPEPSTMFLLAIGLIGLASIKLRKSTK